MAIKRVETADGSHSLYHEELDEQYHSRHGAIREALHVFIQNGLKAIEKDEVRIFEMGFGTGLNFLVTLANLDEKKIAYEAIEAFPLGKEVVHELNYISLLNRKDLTSAFEKAHEVSWNQWHSITSKVELKKVEGTLEETVLEGKYDLVYFDAFGPRVQPHLWELPVFQKCFSLMNSGGVLVTYSAKGSVRRNMLEAGFKVEKLPGPPGKREMLRAIKP